MGHQFIDDGGRRTFSAINRHSVRVYRHFSVINQLMVTDCGHFSIINQLMATDCGYFSIINQLMAGKRMQNLTGWQLMAENDFKTYPYRAKWKGKSSVPETDFTPAQRHIIARYG
jgi:hypothetical protein